MSKPIYVITKEQALESVEKATMLMKTFDEKEENLVNFPVFTIRCAPFLDRIKDMSDDDMYLVNMYELDLYYHFSRLKDFFNVLEGEERVSYLHEFHTKMKNLLYPDIFEDFCNRGDNDAAFNNETRRQYDLFRIIW